MTTNHPANGPVSLDRLHQIREILSKAFAQSDGGNLGYAMADAVKVIDGAIAAFDAEPVPCPKCNDTGMADSGGVQPWGEPILIECDCRADMFQAGNSPVTPDGWIPVSERMPERDVDVQVYCADKKEQMVGYMERNETDGWFRFASLPNGCGVYCKPTHWIPLPAAPQQEVKSALKHGMQRYAGAMQKLSERDK
ncbi:DUF551 domain-containing protein [Salmonella enterica subsp. enterica serovar Kumasi]|nr:DUF551 domain-containing protein [Salmonella enterica subsp. enterica serovar Kumasi]